MKVLQQKQQADSLNEERKQLLAEFNSGAWSKDEYQEQLRDLIKRYKRAAPASEATPPPRKKHRLATPEDEDNSSPN